MVPPEDLEVPVRPRDRAHEAHDEPHEGAMNKTRSKEAVGHHCCFGIENYAVTVGSDSEDKEE